MTQRFIMPGGWYPQELGDFHLVNTTVQELLSKGSFLIEGAIWHVMDYVSTYDKFTPMSYRVKLRADRSNGYGTLYNPYEKPHEVTIEFETVSKADCGECGAAVFFVKTKSGFFNRELIMRDATCCLSKELETQKKQEPFDEAAIKEIFDALYKKNVGDMARSGDFGSSLLTGKMSPMKAKVSQSIIDDANEFAKIYAPYNKYKY